MLHVLFILLSALLVLFALGASVYIFGFALLGLKSRVSRVQQHPRIRFLVLVPAYNEGRSLLPTLRSLQHANYPQDLLRIAVIADNCSDDTAQVARECGVEAWIRNDAAHPGKGQALNWALDKAALSYDLAAIINVDTEVDEDFFASMNSAYIDQLQKGRSSVVLQGRYLFAHTSDQPTWFEHFTIASKAAENSFTYGSRTILGLPNLIQGNGFCISRNSLEQVTLAGTSVVEDAEYAIDLALGGVPVVYVDNAIVTSRMTRSIRSTAPQRARWAGGVFALLQHSIPRLLKAAFRQRRWRLAEMAFMLILTSRLLLVYATISAVVVLDLAYPFLHFRIAAGALALAIILQAIYLYLVLRRTAYPPVPFHTIAFVPLYVGFLGAVQIGAFIGIRRRQWNRPVR